MFSISNLGVYYTGKALFKNISFVINPKDRIGLVGKNGVGKTTILNVISGGKNPDEGSITVPEGRTIGYLPQELKISSNRTIYDEAMTAFEEVMKIEHEIEELNLQLESMTDFQSDEYVKVLDRLTHLHDLFSHLGGDTRESDVEKILKGLGFGQEDFIRPFKEFSGGWQMRVELAKLLLKMPDLLLLDEPTNHLDIESIIWLEDFFNNYPGAIVMVSHDKMFLDNITNRTVEIVFGKIYDYKASYSKYFQLRQERLDQQQAAFNNQQKAIAKQERFVERFRAKATKARQVQSKIKMIDKIERIEFDELDTQTIHFRFPPAPRSGEVALEGKKLCKSYGDNKIISDLDFIIDRGEKVAFVGKNGEGKTTLVKMISGAEKYEGHLKIGHNVVIGYYAQIQEGTLDENITVLQTIEEVATGEWSSISKIRGLLGAFLFDEDDVGKKVKVLSGGEKSRLALAKLLLNPVNLLILDEPTNHLDIPSKEILKEALMQYDGTMIIVSHDRDFLQGLTQKTFEFHEHKIKVHLGEISEFLDSHKVESFREFETTGPAKKPTNNAPAKSSNKSDYKQKKELEKTIRKTKSQINKSENLIQKLEEEMAALIIKMQADDFYSDPAEAKKMIQTHDALKKELSTAMEQWEKAGEKLVRLEAEEKNS